MSYYIIPYHVMSYHGISCHITLYVALCCFALGIIFFVTSFVLQYIKLCVMLSRSTLNYFDFAILTWHTYFELHYFTS